MKNIKEKETMRNIFYRSRWILFIFAIVLTLSLVISSENNNVVPDPIKDIDYQTSSDGVFTIKEQGGNLYDFALTIVGTKANILEINSSNGSVSDFVYNSDDFDWSWSEDSYEQDNKTLYKFTGNSNGELSLRQDWVYDTKLKRFKTTYSITNNIGSDLSDIDYWFVMKVDSDSLFVDNAPEFRVGSLTYNFQDMIDANFTVEDFFLGDGEAIGRGGENVFAVKLHKEGTLPNGVEIVLDPFATSYLSPTIVGDPSSSGWTNPNNVKTSNNAYANTTIVGSTLDMGNFSLLKDEGGVVPNGSFIQGIEISVEGKRTGACFPSTTNVGFNVTLSGDNMTTQTPSSYDAQSGFGGTEDTVVLGGYSSWYWDNARRWTTNELSNKNFRVRIIADTICSGAMLNIDNLQVKVYYTDPPEANTTKTSNTLIHNVIHLALSDSSVMNRNNTLIYLPFDYNNSNRNWYPEDLAFMDVVQQLNTNFTSLSAKWNNNGLIGGSQRFNSSFKERLDIYSQGNMNVHNNMTVMFWAKPYNLSNAVVFFDISASGVTPYRISKKSGGDGVVFTTRNASATVQTCNSNLAILSANTWTHLAFTYNGTAKLIYVNGVLDTTCSAFGNLDFVAPILQIGCSTFPIGSCYDGEIDEFVFMDSALGSTQISQTFTNQTSRFYSRGERIFANLNIITNNTINLTIDSVQPFGSMINVSIGTQSGSSYSYGTEYGLSSNVVNSLAIGTPTNFSIKFILYASPNNFISPIMNESFGMKSYYTDNCAYTSGNWNIDRANNCVISSNVSGNTGANMTVSGTGNFTINAVNITGFYDYIFKGDCIGNNCYDYIITGSSLG